MFDCDGSTDNNEITLHIEGGRKICKSSVVKKNTYVFNVHNL